MIDKVTKLPSDLFSLTRDVRESQKQIEELREESRRSGDKITVLAFELQRLREEMERLREQMRHERESAAKDRDNLQLRLENTLLRSGRVLPPVSEAHDEKP